MRRSLALSFLLLACVASCTSPLADTVDRELAHGTSVDALVARIEAGPPNEREEAYRRLALGRLEADARSTDVATRDRAFASYGAIGHAASSSLERLASGADADVASRASSVLARLGDRRARARLSEDLESTDDARLGRALAIAGTTLPARRLEELMASPDPDVRFEAARALEERSVPNEDLLVDVARHDPEPAVRAQACRAAAKTGTPSRVLAVVDEERSPSTRAACLRALVPRLDLATLRARVEAIAMPLDERGVEEIGALYTAREESIREALDARLPAWLDAERPSIRAAVANVLPSSPSSERAARLRTRLETERVSTVRVSLAARLLSIARDDAHAHTALADVARDRSLDGVEASALLFARGDRSQLEVLRSGLDDASPAVRVVSARSLADEPACASSVARRLDDTDPGVRSAAAIALAR